MAVGTSRDVKRFNAPVCLVILCQTQHEGKNFNNSHFNSLTRPGQKLGMFSDVMHLSAR